MKNNIKTALLMCVYKRIYNLNVTLDCINNQTVKDFDFYIINNNHSIRNDIKRIVKRSNIKNIKIINSDSDTSPFSRFSIAYELSKNGYNNFIIIDDDQIVESSFIEKCLDQIEDNVFKAWWSYRTKDNYFDREILNGEEEGNYAGPGGSVFTKNIFSIVNILKCPEDYKDIDDIWISYNIIKNNFKIKKLNVDIEFIKDDKDVSLFSTLKDKKQKVWKKLFY
jgi:hypothetical protein